MNIWSILSVLILLFFGVHSALFITAHYRHTCALSNVGSAKCWGYNVYGQLGIGDAVNRGDAPNEMGNNLPVIDLGNEFNTTLLKTGYFHTCAVSYNGTVKCWGRGLFGALGRGNTENIGDTAGEMGTNLGEINIGKGFNVIDIALGLEFSCALSDIATVKCWGRNDFGQLGMGDALHRGDEPNEVGNNLGIVDLGNNFTVISLAASDYGVCALSDVGAVKCWGHNSFGTLGIGDMLHRGDGPNEMGNNLTEIDLGNAFNVISIVGGVYHYCALSDMGLVKCWGYNYYGQLGIGDTNNRGDSPNEMGNNLAEVNLGNDFSIASIALGTYQSCAVSNMGKVKCWGRNNYGQLGTESILDIGDETGEMGNNLSVIDLGNGSNGFDIVSLMSLGHEHSCALSSHGEVKCFGYNYYGQLGLGDTVNRGDVANTMGNNLTIVNLVFPTKNPTESPTQPTQNPSQIPSDTPSETPTQNPTHNPSESPTQNPSQNPSQSPSQNPSQSPTENPSQTPTENLSKVPTVYTVINASISSTIDEVDETGSAISCYYEKQYFLLSIIIPMSIY